MNQKKTVEITQNEIDMAKEEYFKNGGVVKILKIQGAKPKKEIAPKVLAGSSGESS
ncbi:MAG: hypothetical protein HQM13_12570 [SAR324 cluster bacterium]|nr:hypothetical protein [SAR324 cluster bacterium]